MPYACFNFFLRKPDDGSIQDCEDAGRGQATLHHILQLQKSETTIYAIFNVVPFRLVKDGGHLSEFKQSLRVVGARI